nr:TIGR04219 family outer membrane beta-barrel protein [Litorivivens lipolytica]
MGAALALALPFSAQADIIGATAGAYSWNQGWSGDLRGEETGDDKIDLEDDLGFDDERANSIFVALEHPIPVLPNIRLASTEMEIKETGTLTRSFNYDGKTYTANSQVTSDFDLSHIDATLYYEILDNIVSVDVGLTARMFDGDATISDGNQTGTSDIDFTIPLLYVGARVDLPLTGLYATGEIHGLKVDDDSIIDTKLGIGYEIGIVAFEAGVRSFEIDAEDDDAEFNMTVEGAFLGVVVDI